MKSMKGWKMKVTRPMKLKTSLGFLFNMIQHFVLFRSSHIFSLSRLLCSRWKGGWGSCAWHQSSAASCWATSVKHVKRWPTSFVNAKGLCVLSCYCWEATSPSFAWLSRLHLEKINDKILKFARCGLIKVLEWQMRRDIGCDIIQILSR